MPIPAQVNALTTNVVSSDSTTRQVTRVLAESVTSELVKEASLQLSTSTINSILADEKVRQNLSEALYSAVTPKLFQRKQQKAYAKTDSLPDDSEEPKF